MRPFAPMTSKYSRPCLSALAHAACALRYRTIEVKETQSKKEKEERKEENKKKEEEQGRSTETRTI